MRWIAMLALLVGCGEGEAAAIGEATTSTGSTEVPAPPGGATRSSAFRAAHGGTVVAVGPFGVEVVAHGDGQIEAFIHDSTEDPFPAGARMSLRLTGDDGGTHAVSLTWDPAEARYRGRLYRVAPIPGPIQVTITEGGREHRGSASTVVVTEPAEPAPVRTPRPPSEDPSAEEASPPPPVEEPVAEAPVAPIEAPVVRPAEVQVRPQVVDRPPVIAPGVRPRTTPGPVLDRRGRATETPPNPPRATAPGGATVRVRE